MARFGILIPPSITANCLTPPRRRVSGCSSSMLAAVDFQASWLASLVLGIPSRLALSYFILSCTPSRREGVDDIPFSEGNLSFLYNGVFPLLLVWAGIGPPTLLAWRHKRKRRSMGALRVWHFLSVAYGRLHLWDLLARNPSTLNR